MKNPKEIKRGGLGGARPRSGGMGIDRPSSNRGKSQVQERRLASKFDAMLTPNSGACPMPSQKGDLTSDLFVWEAKRTEHRRMVISAEVIIKIAREAAHAPPMGKLPLLAFEVSGLPENVDKDWICIPAHAMRWLFDCAEKLRRVEETTP